MYDRYELHKVADFTDNIGITYAEQINTEEDQQNADEEAVNQYWTVFGHIPNKGLDSIIDFYREEEAIVLYDFLSQTLESYKLIKQLYKDYKQFVRCDDGDLFDDKLGDCMDKFAEII